VTGLSWAIMSGALILGGVWAVLGSQRVVHPRLADSLDLLDGRGTPTLVTYGTPLERLGARVLRGGRIAVGDSTRRQLQLRGSTVESFLAHKVVGAIVGLVLPSLLGAALLLVSDIGLALPLLVGMSCGLVGFFVPDMVLRRSAAATTSDAAEALLTFVDLVALERLANQSATQALHAAAEVSDSSVFVAIRDALQRARLEQRAPFAELKRLGQELELPALCDIADVMKLDESGAALSGALRARVKELRDAHLTSEKIAASAVSERMTFFMVVPSLVFGLIFLVPPLLRLIA
jgi:Flp pilus assembly protein TadB